MRKYQKMGCVRYAANDAKAAELESMGYTECTCTKKTVISTSLKGTKETIEDVIKDALKNIDNRQQSAAEENAPEDTSESGNTEEQVKTDSKPGTRRRSGKKRNADSETEPEAPAEDPAPGGDDDGSDSTDNK